MPNIIKDTAIVEDAWQVIAKPEADANLSANDLPQGQIILPLAQYQALASDLSTRIEAGEVALWLDSDEGPDAIESLDKLPLIAINFPAFADGRGYSYAHKLRMQHQYAGELRAIGDVLQDQLFYMFRVGFNSFAMREDQNLEQAIERLQDFSMNYQGAVKQEKPLFATR